MKKINNFVEKAKKIHDNKYDYSKVEYINNRTKVCIICPEHGEFWQVPASHLRGCGCPKCGFNKSINGRTQSREDFVKRAKKIHGDKYDYSKVEYKNAHTKVCIICPKHGEFWQTPINHLNSHGCNMCGIENNTHNRRSVENFVERAKKIHGDKYDYSKVNYVNAHTKICIICPKHGEFWQTPNEHLKNKGCPICNESHLEKNVRIFFDKNNVLYEQYKKFKWLGRQSLDFYLPEYNVAIECQGSQHFYGRENDLFNHNKTLKRDIEKYLKCVKNGVKILYYSDLEFNKKILIYNSLNSYNDLKKLVMENNIA